MQKEQKDTPEMLRLRRTQRLRKALSSDVNRSVMNSTVTSIRSQSSSHRTTMAPSDFALPRNRLPLQGVLQKRKNPTERMSMMPVHAFPDGHTMSDMESKDTGVKLLFDKYLQSIMAELVIKRKDEGTRNMILTQLASMAKDVNYDDEKLFKLKTRGLDILHLTAAQIDIDAQILDSKNTIKKDHMSALKDTLTQLNSVLKSLDILRCNNIVLPTTPDEWQETEEAVKTCSNILRSITDLIGNKGDTCRRMTEGIREFNNMYSEIQDCQTRFEKALCKYQIAELKIASLSLKQDENLTTSSDND